MGSVILPKMLLIVYLFIFFSKGNCLNKLYRSLPGTVSSDKFLLIINNVNLFLPFVPAKSGGLNYTCQCWAPLRTSCLNFVLFSVVLNLSAMRDDITL